MSKSIIGRRNEGTARGGRCRTDCALRRAWRLCATLLPAAALAALAALACAPSSCSRTIELQKAPEGVPQVRVLLTDKADSVKVSIHGPYEIVLLSGPGKQQKLASGDQLGSQAVECAGADVVVGDIVRTPGTVEFLPRRVPVEINGRSYRGSLRISAWNGKLRVVNVLDVESYVRGVVPCEMSPSWALAALEAQATAARSYALTRITDRVREPFDVYATVYDQVYGGFDRETDRTNAAVAATAGHVLRYRGRPLTAYYHACCGGSTADARQVFQEPTSPLRSTPCGYCAKAPRFSWSLKTSLGEVGRKLGVQNVVGLVLQGVGLDGRVTQVGVQLADRSTVVVTGTALRERLGLSSTHFEVTVRGADVVFEGRGWGHGVGMCQWGAKGMAEAGKKCSDILERYYVGAKVTKLY